MIRPIELHGHRGARGLFPENTLAGFAGALAIGVDALELDVAVTADNAVVVTHDARLNPDITRTPDGVWLPAPDHCCDRFVLRHSRTMTSAAFVRAAHMPRCIRTRHRTMVRGSPGCARSSASIRW